jgi:hypothetical protein
MIVEASPTEPNTPTEEASSTQSSSAERRSFSSLINYDPSSQTSTSIFRSASHAEVLRLRLRVAMYKIRTNQVDTPFADLHVELPPQPLSAQDSSAAAREAVEQLRQEAAEVAARRNNTTIKLKPAPVLRPTPYSSRMIYDDRIPSSPPADGLPNGLPSIRPSTDVATPRRTGAPLGSPLSGNRRFSKGAEQVLTSSVVKGRVAEGLLGLRNAV